MTCICIWLCICLCLCVFWFSWACTVYGIFYCFSVGASISSVNLCLQSIWVTKINLLQWLPLAARCSNVNSQPTSTTCCQFLYDLLGGIRGFSCCFLRRQCAAPSVPGSFWSYTLMSSGSGVHPVVLWWIGGAWFVALRGRRDEGKFWPKTLEPKQLRSGYGPDVGIFKTNKSNQKALVDGLREFSRAEMRLLDEVGYDFAAWA